jgi:aspartate-semialdehyde dehydrogenase
MSYSVAVVGATGAVGREVLMSLSERQFPVDQVYALASSSSKGKKVSFGDKDILVVEVLEDFLFENVDIAFFCCDNSLSKVYAPLAAEVGCIVIDKSSYFRMDEDIPLIVPEVNIHALGGYVKRNIIASPNCTTIPRVLALKPLLELSPIKRLISTTYQSVSGAGRDAMDELYQQTRSILMNTPVQKKHFEKQIAFNVIPCIDDFLPDGSTKEEWKNIVETQKILGQDIPISATCVRVPVFVGHSESLVIEFEKPISEREAFKALEESEGVMILKGQNEDSYMTPIECVGDDMVFVSRLRQDPSVSSGLQMWLVSDNLRKGAALNAVQIAEQLVENYL